MIVTLSQSQIAPWMMQQLQLVRSEILADGFQFSEDYAFRIAIHLMLKCFSGLQVYLDGASDS